MPEVLSKCVLMRYVITLFNSLACLLPRSNTTPTSKSSTFVYGATKYRGASSLCTKLRVGCCIVLDNIVATLDFYAI